MELEWLVSIVGVDDTQLVVVVVVDIAERICDGHAERDAIVTVAAHTEL
jgi:hypothetical protein